MMDVAKTFVAGVITIGIITALFMNGRNTAGVLKSGFSGANSLLGTAIKG